MAGSFHAVGAGATYIVNTFYLADSYDQAAIGARLDAIKAAVCPRLVKIRPVMPRDKTAYFVDASYSNE